MFRSEIKRIPAYYQRYVDQVPDRENLTFLMENFRDFMPGETAQLIQVADKRYAAGKWTPKTVLQHVIDAERVFSYRALRFARKDQTPLAGFDQNQYAITAEADNRRMDELLAEFQAVRQSTFLLFQNFDRQQLLSFGEASGQEVSVLGLGYIILGHQRHHANIIREKYFPLQDA